MKMNELELEGKTMLEKELIAILNPRNECSKKLLMVKKILFNKYPRPLSKKERERLEE